MLVSCQLGLAAKIGLRYPRRSGERGELNKLFHRPGIDTGDSGLPPLRLKLPHRGEACAVQSKINLRQIGRFGNAETPRFRVPEGRGRDHAGEPFVEGVKGQLAATMRNANADQQPLVDMRVAL